MAKRNIVKIDEKKCNGCGLCVPNCAEGAIKIAGGKARLVSDVLCDGLGACLGHCPQGAITIEEREAVDFDETKAGKKHAHMHSGCPGSKMMSSGGEAPLSNWPVQIKLIPANAPYFKDADILIAADCVPFAYPDFHEKLLKGKILMVGCPKLDDLRLYKEKITEIIKNNTIKAITYARMEVPCCSGLVTAAKEAIAASGKDVPFEETVISIKGACLK
ncbi:MAG: 4Fe-4S binding protein [Candidatus Omnitrophica bacterium]|nr:4Fe-4S binding protein [Candidatus Omnitrophota bacterium]